MRQMKNSCHYFSPHPLDRFLSIEYQNSQVSEAVTINCFQSQNGEAFRYSSSSSYAF
jgi:hypothetical protein